MTVVGLPTALEATLGALLQESHVTSWKIVGEASNTTIILRLRTTTENVNMAGEQTPPTSLHYRKKPPCHIKRDRRRREDRGAEERRQTEEMSRAATSQETGKESEFFATEHSTLFMPTPPSTHAVSHTNTSLSPCNTPPNLSPCSSAREFRRRPCDVNTPEVDTVADQRCEIDLADVFSTSETGVDDNCDTPLRKADEAGYGAAVIKDYVSELTDRSLQRKLRDAARNQDFSDLFASYDSPDTLVCVSDDVVFQFDWMDGSETPADFFWFVKRDFQHMTQEERAIYSRLQQWTPVDRDRFKDRISAGLEVLHVIMDAVRFLLG